MQLADLVDWLGNGSPVPEDTLATVQVSQLFYSIGFVKLFILNFIFLFRFKVLFL